jgi:hypothetical protein
MRWLPVLTLSALIIVPSVARAQYVPAPPLSAPETTPAPAPEPAPEAPAPRPSPRPPHDTEDPPPPSHTVTTTPVQASESLGSGFAVELGTSSFASGSLSGGVMVGAHTADGSILGIRLDYVDTTTKINSDSTSRTAFSLGLAGRLSVAGGRNGLDLALAIDAGFDKAQLGEAPTISGGTKPLDASGVHVGLGPQIRYWVRPSIALGYLVEWTYASLTADSTDRTDKLEQTSSGISGTFTITGAF